MKNLTKREKMLLVILLVVGIGYLYYFFLLNPMLANINISKQSIEEYDAKLQEIENVIATNDKFKEDYDSVMEKYILYSSRMPYSYRDPEIAYNLMELAMKTSSEIKSISFSVDAQPVNVSDKIWPIPVSIVLESSNYVNAMNLVKLIETDTRMVQVKSLSLSSNTDPNSNSSVISANLGLEYYYVKDDTEDAIEYNFNNGSYGKSDLFK